MGKKDEQYYIETLVDVIANALKPVEIDKQEYCKAFDKVELKDLKTLLKLHEIGIDLKYYSDRCLYTTAIWLYNEGYDLTRFPLLYRKDVLTDEHTINLAFHMVCLCCRDGKDSELLNYLGQTVTDSNHVSLAYSLMQIPNITLGIVKEINFKNYTLSSKPLIKGYVLARLEGITPELAEKVYKYCKPSHYKTLNKLLNHFGEDKVTSLIHYVYNRNAYRTNRDSDNLIEILDELSNYKDTLTSTMVTQLKALTSPSMSSQLKNLSSYSEEVLECIKVTKGEVIPTTFYVVSDILKWAYGKDYIEFCQNPTIIKYHETFPLYTIRLTNLVWLVDLLFEVCHVVGIDWSRYLPILNQLTFLDIQFIALGVDILGYKALDLSSSELQTIYEANGKRVEDGEPILQGLWCIRFRQYYNI